MNTNKKQIFNRLSNTKLLAMDFDGTLTVGAFVFTDENGKESVICSRRDSLGIDMVKNTGVEVCVISKETNVVVASRCKKLQIDCYQAVGTGEGKKEILARIINEKLLKLNEIVFVGDDINDIHAMDFVKGEGVAVAVADAHDSVKKIATFTLQHDGGKGAVRELCELILEAKGIMRKV